MRRLTALLALQGACATDLLKLVAQTINLHLDRATIALYLTFAGAAKEAATPALPFKMRP